MNNRIEPDCLVMITYPECFGKTGIAVSYHAEDTTQFCGGQWLIEIDADKCLSGVFEPCYLRRIDDYDPSADEITEQVEDLTGVES